MQSSIARSPRRRSTLRDIAAETKLAVSTVSNILGKSPYSWASKETRQRVFEVAQRMGYCPNRLGRGLVRRKLDLLGLVIPDQKNPVYADIVHGAILEAEKERHEIFLCAAEESCDREREFLTRLAAWGCDGIILMPVNGTLGREVFDLLDRAAVPWVVVGELAHGIMGDSISCAFEEAAYLLTRRLLSLGRRKFCFLGASVSEELASSRFNGYRRALAEAGLAAEKMRTICSSPNMSGVYGIVWEAFRSFSVKPDALVCLNDLSAIAACRAIEDCGLRVPSDVAVVGFDNIEMGRYLRVPLTTVDYDTEAIGQQAVRMLFERMKNPDIAPRTIQMNPHLIVRSSCGAELSAAPENQGGSNP